MLSFVRHKYGFKIVHPDDGTVGGITYYDKYVLIGGLLRDYEIKEIFESINNILDEKYINKPVTLKYIPSLFYSRKGIYKTPPTIYSLHTTDAILEKFKYAQQSLSETKYTGYRD